MLEPIGFAKFAPALREDPGGCESADHPKIARTAEGVAYSKSPVWFRLVRLRGRTILVRKTKCVARVERKPRKKPMRWHGKRNFSVLLLFRFPEPVIFYQIRGNKLREMIPMKFRSIPLQSNPLRPAPFSEAVCQSAISQGASI